MRTTQRSCAAASAWTGASSTWPPPPTSGSTTGWASRSAVAWAARSQRNRAKRLLRDAFRRRARRPAVPCDLVLVAKREILGSTRAELDRELAAASSGWKAAWGLVRRVAVRALILLVDAYRALLSPMFSWRSAATCPAAACTPGKPSSATERAAARCWPCGASCAATPSARADTTRSPRKIDGRTPSPAGCRAVSPRADGLPAPVRAGADPAEAPVRGESGRGCCARGGNRHAPSPAPSPPRRSRYRPRAPRRRSWCRRWRTNGSVASRSRRRTWPSPSRTAAPG